METIASGGIGASRLAIVGLVRDVMKISYEISPSVEFGEETCIYHTLQQIGFIS